MDDSSALVEVSAIVEDINSLIPAGAAEGEVVETVDSCAKAVRRSYTSRTWPSPAHFVKAMQALGQTQYGAPTPEPMDSAQIAGARMGEGKPVGEGWLYGVMACELIARGLVDQDTMRRYRSTAYFARKDTMGADAAKAWEDGALERHDAGKAIYKARGEKRDARSVTVPDKRNVPQGAF